MNIVLIIFKVHQAINIKQGLTSQIASVVEWQKSMEYLEQEVNIIVFVGPGKGTFNLYERDGLMKAYSIASLEDILDLEKLNCD